MGGRKGVEGRRFSSEDKLFVEKVDEEVHVQFQKFTFVGELGVVLALQQVVQLQCDLGNVSSPKQHHHVKHPWGVARKHKVDRRSSADYKKQCPAVIR